jgi:hypothetical protein
VSRDRTLNKTRFTSVPGHGAFPCLLVVGMLWAGTFGAYAAKEPIPPNVTLYVATDGNDAWTGALPAPAPDKTDGPLASLEGARNRIRELRTGSKIELPVDVFFREGRYRMDATVTFEPADSATEQTPVTFCAYRDEDVEFCGSRTIDGWTIENGIWKTDLPDVKNGDWYFRTLFVNGKRAQRARTPDNPAHFLTVAKQLKKDPASGKKRSRYETRPHRGFHYSEGDIKNWPRLNEAVFFTYEAWARGIRKVEFLDESSRTVLFRRGACWPAIHSGENRYWVENVPELLNVPGEWYLDRRSGVLSYIPRPDETPNNTEILAPRVSRFVQLRGTARAGNYVEYLHFRELAFRYGDWEMEDTGYVAYQADIVVPGAIDMVGARHCSVSRCEISHVGLYGINLGQGSRHVRMFHNHLFDLGGGGVKIGHNYFYSKYPFEQHPDGVKEGWLQHAPLPPERRCGYSTIENNFIHHGGVIFASGIGACLARASWNRLAHNEISDFPYSGVSVGMSWDSGPSWAHDNLIEYNHIHRIGRRHLSDLGGIYLLGNSPGTVVRGNHIHDIHHRHYGSTCLYGDQGSSRLLIEDNLFHHAGGTLFNGGFGQNTVRNNIFAFAEGATFWQLGGVGALHRNLIYSAGERLCVQWNEPGATGSACDSNLYWNSAGAEPEWDGQPLTDWLRESGRGTHSVVADPGFADPQSRDFSLGPDSTALKLGFSPLDVARVGLFGEREWVSLPETIAPMPMAELSAGKLAPITHDFEDDVAGAPPATFVLHAATEQGGIIAVAADAAAEGKHSLMLQDATTIKADYNPHMYRQLGFGTGTLQVSFALMTDADAQPQIELRDYANGAPFTSGPSVQLDATHQVVASGRELGLRVPSDTWIRYQIDCKLDQGRNGAYNLSVTLPDGTVKTFEDLPYGNGNFRIATWIGIISAGKHNGRFHVDSLTCTTSD